MTKQTSNKKLDSLKGRLLLYLPVIHQGYLDLLQHYQRQLDEVLILDESLITLVDKELDYLHKDIRRLKPKEAAQALAAYHFPFRVGLATVNLLQQTEFLNETNLLLMPDDDISQVLIKHFFKPEAKNKIKLTPVFLRWHKENTFKAKRPRVDALINFSRQRTSLAMPLTPEVINKTKLITKKSTSSMDKDFIFQAMEQAFQAAGKATDWWRHVGAALVKNHQVVLLTHNQHTPGGYTPYIDGDPRSAGRSGQQIEIGTSEHAESTLIAEAAKRGLSTQDCDLYVTTFPCPYCARIIAHAGIKTLYFAEGYTVLDGLTEMKRAGVKIVKVNLPEKVKKMKDRNTRLCHYKSHHSTQ